MEVRDKRDGHCFPMLRVVCSVLPGKKEMGFKASMLTCTRDGSRAAFTVTQ